MEETIRVDTVVVDSRIRKDMGDIDELANSIRAVGLIQPIVITRDNKLIAGERRLRALRKLGIDVLIHAYHFIYNDEIDDLKLKAMEIEENVKRKQLSWQEEVTAKKRLLEVLQQIHGVARAGRPTSSEQLGVTSPGFGIIKLASLLGESSAQTSKDLELASLIEAVPQLAKAETKEAARRQAVLAASVAVALQQAMLNPPKLDQKWTLYEGDFNDNASNLVDESVDFIVVDPPYGEDNQGMGPNSKTLIAAPFADSRGDVLAIVEALARESYRVLRMDKFAVFFFGFIVYPDLVRVLGREGFNVDLSPLIWVKDNVINTSPYTRYGRSYEPILVARKGEPKLMRPSQRDVIEVQNVITRGTNEQKFYQAQKPVELIERLISDMCPPEGTVVDWCAGSGTAGVAALRQRKRVVLFEKDVAACNIIRARLGSL
jgi:ParB family transcriptional regulator, chromosome partitioning protein